MLLGGRGLYHRGTFCGLTPVRESGRRTIEHVGGPGEQRVTALPSSLPPKSLTSTSMSACTANCHVVWPRGNNVDDEMRVLWRAADCAALDEPFYVRVARFGPARRNPMQAEILASQSDDPRRVSSGCCARRPDGKTVQYQKQMTPSHGMPDFRSIGPAQC